MFVLLVVPQYKDPVFDLHSKHVFVWIGYKYNCTPIWLMIGFDVKQLQLIKLTTPFHHIQQLQVWNDCKHCWKCHREQTASTHFWLRCLLWKFILGKWKWEKRSIWH